MALTSQSLFSPLVACPSRRGRGRGRSASMSAASSHNSQSHNHLFVVSSCSPKSESETPKTLACAVTAAASGTFLLASFGGGGGGWGAGGGGAGSSFWSQVFSAGVANANEKSSGDWDPHGLPANISVPLTKLSGLKRYKVSELKFFDRAAVGGCAYTGPEDSFEMVTLYPGGMYTKSQLLKELETLVYCGMFERVDLEGKAKPDGTLSLTVSFVESVWSAAKQFKCINVGLMAQSGQVDFDQDMTEREKMDYLRKQERDYQQRVRGAKPCILPESARGEVLGMMKKQEKVSARMLQRIRDHIQKLYHNEGFVCAQVVNFGNLNTSEVVCEVVEGDITKVEFQFQDKLILMYVTF